ncbi:hypothetical protein AVEN_32890-1 [Araneus ventricosus]|uniref:Uncharacterized protein n=1 Tax=Araneus ventricosus TaxID=182803 RepID=A0A4Y2QUP0_ARAVE|nr:hypothetical protein AVEN_32890-1 [Araneus ventricosus]
MRFGNVAVSELQTLCRRQSVNTASNANPSAPCMIRFRPSKREGFTLQFLVRMKVQWLNHGKHFVTMKPLSEVINNQNCMDSRENCSLSQPATSFLKGHCGSGLKIPAGFPFGDVLL